MASSNKKKLDLLKEQFPNLITIVCDLSNKKAVEDLISQCRRKHSDINVLINNAGVQYNYSWIEENYPNPLIEKELRINLLSPLQITQGLMPLLAEKSESAIVNVSSVLAVVPKQSAPVYCASKAGLHIFTKALRYQLESSQIKVFEILPPLVDTPMTHGRGKGKISPDQLVDEFIKNFKSDHFEINIGKTKLLRFLKRLAPGFAYGLLKNN